MRTVPFFKSFSVFKGGITSMFIPIDYEQWDRKEIYDAFHGYLYCMTVELDITEFLKKIHENHWKFYPSMCYCIAKTVNGHQDYRYAKINGQVGYYRIPPRRQRRLPRRTILPPAGRLLQRILMNKTFCKLYFAWATNQNHACTTL